MDDHTKMFAQRGKLVDSEHMALPTAWRCARESLLRLAASSDVPKDDRGLQAGSADAAAGSVESVADNYIALAGLVLQMFADPGDREQLGDVLTRHAAC